MAHNKMSNVERIFESHVKGSPKKAIVKDITVKFCTLTNEVQKVCELGSGAIHITTRVIKKNYDKRPAEENHFILKNGWQVVRMPDEIYLNKDEKRGDYLFARQMNDNIYIASIEVVEDEEGRTLYVASLFRAGKPENYLQSYKLVWSWKGGKPSS